MATIPLPPPYRDIVLTPPLVTPRTRGTLGHAVNPDDPSVTRCHRRTDRMISLDPKLLVSIMNDAKGDQRRTCRVCNFEEKKARGLL